MTHLVTTFRQFCKDELGTVILLAVSYVAVLVGLFYILTAVPEDIRTPSVFVLAAVSCIVGYLIGKYSKK